jgi:signal transduction histidine kinase
VFDYEELQRFDIDPKALNIGSKIINKPKELHSLFIVVLILLGSSLLTTIILSIVIHFKRKKALELNQLIDDRTSQLQMAVDELKSVNQNKDEFISILSHDLKAPFNSMKGLSNLLHRNYNSIEEEERRAYIKHIDNGIDKSFHLLENLLEWSRAQQGKIAFKPEAIDLRSVLEEVKQINELALTTKSISLKFDLPDECKFFADRNMLSTILRNLINNAIKFTPEEGRIIVHGCSEEEINYKKYATITVIDSGIGMDESMAKNLFNIEKDYSRKGTSGESGTGLGLKVCKKFMDMHNGIIDVESDTGLGTSIKLYFPKE